MHGPMDIKNLEYC